jgi:hypothetical protein
VVTLLFEFQAAWTDLMRPPTVPMIVLFPLGQRHFVRGIATTGGGR